MMEEDAPSTSPSPSAPSSTSSLYSHLSMTPGSSLSSLPRHLTLSNSLHYRSPDSHTSVVYSPLSSVSTPSLGGRCLTPSSRSLFVQSSAIAATHTTNTTTSVTVQPFVPTVNFDAIERRTPSPMVTAAPTPNSTSMPSPPEYNIPTWPSYHHSPHSSGGADNNKFQPDFFPTGHGSPTPHREANVNVMQSKFDAMDQLMEATLSSAGNGGSAQPTHGTGAASTGASSRVLRLNSGGAPDRIPNGGVPPSLLSRSRFAHLGAASVGAASPLAGSHVARRIIGKELTPDLNMDDLVDSFRTFDAIPIAASFTADSSPIQSVRRLGSLKSVPAGRRFIDSPGPSTRSTPRTPTPGNSYGVFNEQHEPLTQFDSPTNGARTIPTPTPR